MFLSNKKIKIRITADVPSTPHIPTFFLPVPLHYICKGKP